MTALSLESRKSFQRPSFAAVLILVYLLSTVAVSGQQLPDRIRGYKVFEAKASPGANTSAESSGQAGTAIEFTAPKLVTAGLTGITFEIDAHLNALGQSGRVDFLTFHDFRVNGVPVEVEEFVYPFAFHKDELIKLPEPLRIFLPSYRVAQAAWNEMKDSQENWKVTGRVFVFGKFRKFGMHFKRVVPVDVSIEIKNPLRSNPS